MAKARIGAEGEFYRHVGSEIRRRRDAAGLKQDELAVRVGISRASIANVEAGKQAVPLHILLAISKTLEASVDSLLPNSPLKRRPLLDETVPVSVRQFINQLAIG